MKEVGVTVALVMVRVVAVKVSPEVRVSTRLSSSLS